MKRGLILAVVGAVVALGAIAGGVFYFTRATAPQFAGVPPLPAGTRPFGNWALIGCGNSGGAPRCTLMHRVIARQNQRERVVLQMNVLRTTNGASILLVTLPANIVIPAGVTVTPMGGTAAKGAVRACRPQACSAVLVLSDALAKEMSATNTTNLQFVAATGRAVNLNLNTTGFNQGFAAWRAALPPLPPAAKSATPETQTGATPAKEETPTSGDKAPAQVRAGAQPAREPARSPKPAK